MEFYESPDGIGRAVNKSTHLGTTYVELVGAEFRGSYPLSTLSFVDLTEELLNKLPDKGADLPYDPRARYTNPGETTIEPDHKLPANLHETNSLQNVTQPDSNIMDPFPTDTHRLVTPYHSASFAAALRSLSDVDAEQDPQQHNDALQDIEYEPEYTGEDHWTHAPFNDDPYSDNGEIEHDSDNNGGTLTDPTSEEWGVPAVQQFPAHGAGFQGRTAPRLHFQVEAELPDWMKDKVEEKEIPQWIKDRVKINPEDYNTHDWEGAIDPDTGERINHGPGIPFRPHGNVSGDTEPGEFVEDSEDTGTFGDHEAAWGDQSPRWDVLPSSSTLDGPFDTNNWDDRKMAPGNHQQDGAQVDPKGAGDSGGTKGGEDHDESTDGPWEELEPTAGEQRKSTFDFLSDYKYVKPSGGGKYKIVQKGTGKTLSEHDSKEEAEAAFRAMEMNMHGGSREGAIKQSPQGFFVIGPGGHQLGPYPTEAAAQAAEQTEHNAEEVKKNQEQSGGGSEIMEPKKVADFDEEIPRRWKQYFAFLDNDRDAREAAWADVRAKGQRLSREGNVHVDKYTSFQTDAKVQGDSAEYDVIVYRTAGWSKGVAHYACNCEWGQWAYRRQFYYGRFCSHGYATYLEQQKLDTRRRNGPLDDNLLVAAEYAHGDEVRITEAGVVPDIDGISTIAVVSGDMGMIRDILDDQYATVRLHASTSDDVVIPLDSLERVSFSTTSFEEHDDDSDNDSWGSAAFESDDAADGDSGVPNFAKDQLEAGGDDVTASLVESRDKTTLDQGQVNPHHEDDIHVFSDDLEGTEVPHVPENSQLRSMTKFDDPHFADAADMDEQDNPSTEPQLSSPQTMAGGEDFGNVGQSDSTNTTANVRHAELDWLNESNTSSSHIPGNGLVDSYLAAKLSPMENGPRKIQKSSAKIYSPMEQLALVDEEGRSDLVDHLNLANSFYES